MRIQQFMKKQVNLFVLLLMVTMLLSTSAVNAETVQDSSIISGNEFSQAVKERIDDLGNLNSKDQKYIVENSTQLAKEEFYDMAIKEVNEKVEKDDFHLEGETFAEKTYALDCGGNVTVTLEDEMIEEEESLARECLKTKMDKSYN